MNKIPTRARLASRSDKPLVVDGYKPTDTSSFVVHISLATDGTHQDDCYTMSHIKTGLSCSKIVPSKYETLNSMLQFALWIEAAAPEQVQALNEMPFNPESSSKIVRLTGQLYTVAQNYKKGN